jgi:hypothetical protein
VKIMFLLSETCAVISLLSTVMSVRQYNDISHFVNRLPNGPDQGNVNSQLSIRALSTHCALDLVRNCDFSHRGPNPNVPFSHKKPDILLFLFLNPPQIFKPKAIEKLICSGRLNISPGNQSSFVLK